jgi:hypothetical protein
MSFRLWNKVKKQLSLAKEKEVATLRPKRDDESKEERHLESKVQSYEDIQPQSLSKQPPGGEPGAATNNDIERIQDIGLQDEEDQLTPAAATITTASSHDYDRDYILNILHLLPEQWMGKEMKLHVIADRKDAAWITKRVFQDVERGLITAQFTVKESNHKCDIMIILKIADGLASFPSAVTAINPILSFILTDIKTEAISRRNRKIKGSN